MSKLNKLQLLSIITILSFALTLGGCAKNKEGAAQAAAAAAVITAQITGKVSASSSSSSSKVELYRLFPDAQFLMGDFLENAVINSDGCSSGTFSGAYVGAGGTVVASGSFSGGSFTVPDVPVKKELILTFSCSNGSTQRCLVKSGDSGVYCNPVADAVMSAFEVALGKTITDSSFSGKSIAKIGAGIVQAAQTDGTATEAFNAQITACQSEVDKSTCYHKAIVSSGFAGAFKMMKTLASGWTVESIFTLMVDVFGFELDVDGFIYSDFATKMDSWLSTDFVAQTRAFVASVVADQASNGNEYVVKLECQGGYSKYHAGGNFKFSPVMATINGLSQPTCKNSAALLKNGLTNSQVTALFAAMDADQHGGVDLSTTDPKVGGCNGGGPQYWDNVNYFCMWPPRLNIVSKFTEPNRNDLDGTHSSGRNFSRTHVSMINVFSEIEQGIGQAAQSQFNQQNNCMTNNNDGPPTIASGAACQNWFGNLMAEQRKNFAGLIGLYMYLKDSSQYGSGEDALLSLSQIHKIFTGSSFLNARLSAWSPGYGGKNAGNLWLPPLLAYSNGIFTMQNVFKWDYQGVVNSASLQAALAASSTPYEQSFEMFENIPSASDIKSWVFGSAHHEEWNPTGGRFFYAAAVKETNKPIFCKMINTDTQTATEVEVSNKVRISCIGNGDAALADIGAVDSNGIATVPDGFNYPYTLQERGWQGDSKGRIYALADRKLGMPIRPGEKEVLIYQLHSGNSASECRDMSEKDTVINAKIKYGWGDGTKEEAVSAYCMDMSPFTMSNQLSFYNGGQVEVSQSDGNGNTWKWSVPQVGRVKTDGDATSIAPICYFAPSTNLTIDSGTKLVSGNNATVTSGEITNVGNAFVDLCSSTHANTTKYYVVQFGSGSWATSKANLKAYLLGTQSGDTVLQYRNWANGLNWDDLLLFMKAATLEAALGANNKVSPDTPPTFTVGVKLANQKYNAKFDPYCDDLNSNGVCDCYTAGTTNLKDAGSCSLEDDAAEPTLSQPPYWVGGNNTALFVAFFNRFGGKSGEDLHWTNDGQTVPFDGSYVNNNQLWMDWSEVFQCKFKVTGESSYRKPKNVRWDGFWKNAEGCPNAQGAVTNYDWNEATGGGPIRLVNPKPMNNAYNIERPNTLIKLINYATKGTGQGVAIGKTEKVFSFDEALAMVALRFALPNADIGVYEPGTSSADETKRIKEAFPFYETVRIEGQNDLDPASAVLRGLTRPAELQ